MANFHVYAGAVEGMADPGIRRVGFADLIDALGRGLDDFMAKPSHLIFLCLFYPIIGVVLAAWTSGANALPLLFPLMSGFALVGPVAAIGLYEISRRRAQGEEPSWRQALDVRRSPAVPAMIAVGAWLAALFITWMLTAQAIYTALFGETAPASLSSFLDEIFTTGYGWSLMFWGNLAGLVFAALVLCTTVVAFPMLLDRDCGAYMAVRTSVRAVAANPLMMVVWGIIVAAGLALGSLPVFAGLAVVIPVLGHATWHLYRKVVM